ncbi:hypothetical protein [Rhodoferax aquaticus]|uniref:Uncharacterized protein n=1 Tax=Rhodoferax aquaticus TaxID=2527691 RepID=A0A515EK06_9BURK|nr:hypothetical protein [Rhodoferax aquaticus]QDL52991.1 hypothetical protein EXZ61_01735 [Rhodoferax aquaticus]
MPSYLLPLHLVFVGVWLGCVLTEALFERALLGQGRAFELVLVALHKKVDLLIEIPAFVGVLVTGALMLHAAPPSNLLHLKAGLGVLAIAANAYCVWLVFRRGDAAQAGDWERFERIDHAQHTWGAVVLVGILAALGIGLYLFSHG